MDLIGTRADDTLLGTVDSETIFGRLGDDSIFGYFGDDELRGGNGDDFVSGTGGPAYALESPPWLMTAATGANLYGGNGDDWLATEMVGWSHTNQTGGAGPDVFEVEAEAGPFTPIDQNRVDILDFGVGDKLAARLWLGGENFVEAKDLFALLDTNHDKTLDGHDAPSVAGGTWSAPDALVMVIGDGDMVVVHGVTALTDGQIYG